MLPVLKTFSKRFSIHKVVAFMNLGILFLLFIHCSPVNQRYGKMLSTNTNSPFLSVSITDTLKIIFAEDESTPIIMAETDKLPLMEYINGASYDSIWNKGDIMIKMVAPDYTIIHTHQDQVMDMNDWIFIWKESGKFKYQNKWYILSENKKKELFVLLDKYKN